MTAQTSPQALNGVLDVLGFHQELAGLQKDSVRIIGSLALGAGYVSVFWLLWLTVDGIFAPAGAWIGVAVLVCGSLIALRQRDERPVLARYLQVSCILAAVSGLALAFPSRESIYLLILPIIFAGVLMSQRAFWVTAGLVEGLVVVTGGLVGAPLFAAPVMLPAMIIAVVTAVSWLAVYNLHTTLAWALMGYEQARKGEGLAREHEAELRRALKALDEATYRIARANDMLALARDQADEARRLKQQFAQTISHELRTPLNLIVGFTELMTESPEYYGGPLLPSYQRDLNIVYRNARHLQSLVNDVLDLARIDAIQMTMTLETMAPAILVQEAVNTVHSLVESRGLSLRIDLAPDLPELHVDPTRIRQVLINLLNNAARFTERGGITVRVRGDGDGVVFAVQDTGVGIAAEDMPRIFEEFRQVDSSTRRAHEGAGLGLAISQRFVQLHGGRVWAESEIGKGSTFFFRLPARSDALALPDPQLAASTPLPPQPPGETVLLTVTSSPAAASLLTRSLRDMHTVVVPDLAQANRAMESVVPQVVLVDQACCPAGSEAVTFLSHNLGMTGAPLIVCPLPDEARLSREVSVDGYVMKPVSRHVLWDVLRRFGEEIDTVLIVDDDRDFVRLISRILEDNPVRRYRAVEAYSGQEALELLALYHPDLVLLDLDLPDMHGFRVVEILRANAAWRAIPVVVVTGEELLDAQRPLAGQFVISRPDGLAPYEIVRLIRNVAEMAVKTPSTPAASIPTRVR